MAFRGDEPISSSELAYLQVEDHCTTLEGEKDFVQATQVGSSVEESITGLCGDGLSQLQLTPEVDNTLADKLVAKIHRPECGGTSPTPSSHSDSISSGWQPPQFSLREIGALRPQQAITHSMPECPVGSCSGSSRGFRVLAEL